MTELRETFVKPDAALEGASTLSAAGARLAARWKGLAGTINTLNGGHPWGDDEPGQAFNKDYLGGEQPAQKVLDLAAGVVPVVEQMGPTVKGAVEGTVDVDDMVKTLFGGEGK
ncbi:MULTISPECIES: hypothetical protein [Micromonospora]|uniref:Uncharacterized protein n=1 Tax=Micromonospora maris TaxID=1003110 RepID=A0A9X0LE56_9ACTN|nr:MULTISPECIES: hypothetical protein [Micromonospora]AEB47780.1 hypothetical protein VAB18032_03480 [Micromonospora maris AB-18-032]KUJ46795.1 hypothetical protein ADL17_28455 [Micromonospora maris]RUL90015.1 hypothetical protein EG812_27670 [Verrucosispora sp. FIM060022]